MTRITEGASALEVVLSLVELYPRIASLTFIRYRVSPTFKQLSRQAPLPFEQALKRRLLHGGKETGLHTLARETLSPEEVQRLIDELPDSTALAVSSRVALNGNTSAHISLLDFQCAQSRRNLKRVRLAMRRLSPEGGFILHSGNSYHFYGTSLLSNSSWREFVGRCLLLEPLVDVRYLGHCLINGEAALRISPNRGSSPIVAAIV